MPGLYFYVDPKIRGSLVSRLNQLPEKERSETVEGKFLRRTDGIFHLTLLTLPLTANSQGKGKPFKDKLLRN